MFVKPEAIIKQVAKIIEAQVSITADSPENLPPASANTGKTAKVQNKFYYVSNGTAWVKNAVENS